jgi:hypothetical protein
VKPLAKPIFISMDSRPDHWGPIPPGCLPFTWVDDRENWAQLTDASLMAYPPGMALTFDLEDHTPSRVAKMIAKVKQCRKKRPDLRYGWIGGLPIGGYYPPAYLTRADDAMGRLRRGEKPIDGDDWWVANYVDQIREHSAWERANWADRPLASNFDFLCPYLYVFETSDVMPKRPWVAGVIAECQRLAPSLPCYPVLWQTRHPSATKSPAGDLPPPEWDELLTLVLDAADGAMLWMTSGADYVRAALAKAAA